MWTELLTAIALLLVVEGVLPFLNPAGVRRALLALSEVNDGTLRFMGLTSMVLGVVLLTLAR
mgnify:FL=1